ncbi:MAG TPA: sugar phosphate isomerase/epimerase family protein [Bryobacterales bacterium]|nr:sugar phosphate isomerase/epimerase family protein [Bryobacterales bacterium]
MKLGMCDWSLRARDPSSVPLAKKLGLDGLQLQMGEPKDNVPLRRHDVQQQYLEAGRRDSITFPAICPLFLNQFPLFTEPVCAIYALDSIEAARNLGAKVVMLPFFGKGELKEPWQIDRTVEVLGQLAPRAEKEGIVFGFENTLSAEDNLKVLDRVGWGGIQVWYDVGNSSVRGYDVPAEIRRLGRERICMFHIKDDRSLLGEGAINFPAIAAAVRDIRYDGWLVLETASPNDLEADTRRNIAYVRRTFAF